MKKTLVLLWIASVLATATSFAQVKTIRSVPFGTQRVYDIRSRIEPSVPLLYSIRVSHVQREDVVGGIRNFTVTIKNTGRQIPAGSTLEVLVDGYECGDIFSEYAEAGVESGLYAWGCIHSACGVAKTTYLDQQILVTAPIDSNAEIPLYLSLGTIGKNLHVILKNAAGETVAQTVPPC